MYKRADGGGGGGANGGGGFRGGRNNQSSRGGGGYRGGRGSGSGPADSGCFKCGQPGHMSRECPNAASFGGGRGGGGRGGGRGGFGNLNINIDGTLKTDVGKILKEFQENPDLQEYAFPPDLNNTERRFIHTFCKNFGLTSKSTGGPKGSPNRYCVIYKNRGGKEEKAARKHPLASLSFNAPESANLIDGFLSHFQLPVSAAAGPLQQDEVDLAALARAYVAPKNAGDIARLSENLQALQNARDSARQASPASTLQHFRSKLPIHAQRDDILRMVDENQVIVLSSSTGSGKSTQVPQYLLEHLDARGIGGGADIIVTQPRRISAMSLAQRVAQEREVQGDSLGDTVGYQIRLESKRSSKTRLLYCTIGVLLRRLSTDRLLQGISHIIVDEVHERDRLCDFLLIILRDILPLRKDLKLILMSATLNADMFSKYFGAQTPHIHIEGFTYPVHTFYLEDVIELTGYTPPSNNRLDPSQRRQQEAAKEAKLRDMLNMVMNQVLTIEGNVPVKQPGGIILNPSQMEDDEAKDDDAALAALANIAALGGDSSYSFASASAPAASIPSDLLAPPTNKVTGWTDTYVYTPTVENPWATGDAESSMLSALDAIVGGGDAPSTSLAASLVAPVITVPAPKPSPSLHPSAVSSSKITATLTKLSKASASPAPGATLQNPLSGLTYSPDTVDAIRRIEEEGMDYIDYDLILRTILFICQKFDESMLGGGASAGKKGANPRSQMESEDDDPINIYNGSILVFIPGWEDICKLLEMVAAHPVLKQERKYMCLPLHGSISSQQQRLIFQRPEKGQRKIIFSTNIAETSITIDDVVFVIDSGKMKEKSYDAMTKMCALSSTWVSQANAKQRSGRAGRCRRGVCFRLYTTAKYNSMDVFQTPELLRTPLEELCLQVKLLRLGKVETFLSKALQPPARHSVMDAVDLLRRLGALDANEGLTILGEYLAAMPLDPRLAKMILYGAIFKCLDPVLTMAAALSYRDPFVLPIQFERERAQQARQKLANGSQSDMLCLLNAFHGYSWQLANNGMRGAGNFCREHFLSITTMQMIDKLKVQFMDTLKETGWLDHLVPGAAPQSGARKNQRDHSSHSRAALRNLTGNAPELNLHQHNLSVLTSVVCLGMYPMCAKVQPQNPAKKRRAILCTRNNLMNVCLHPSCVSSKDFRRVAAHNSAWTNDARISLAGPDDPPMIVQHCVFFESMRSSEVYLRNVHWVEPILLALFGTGDRTKLVRSSPEPSSSPAPRKPKAKRSPQPDEDGEFLDDEDEDEDEEPYEDEEDSDDEDNANVFHVDEWIRFAVRPDDAERILRLRQYLAFILDSFIRRAGAHSHGAPTTADAVRTADTSVEFFVSLLSKELTPVNARQQRQHNNSAHSQPQQQQQQYRSQPQPQQRIVQQQPYQQQHYQQQAPMPQPQIRVQQRPASAAAPHQQPYVHQQAAIPPPFVQQQYAQAAPAPAARIVSKSLSVHELEAQLMRFKVEAAQEAVAPPVQYQQQAQPSARNHQQALYEPPPFRGGGRGGGRRGGRGGGRGGGQQQQQ